MHGRYSFCPTLQALSSLPQKKREMELFLPSVVDCLLGDMNKSIATKTQCGELCPSCLVGRRHVRRCAFLGGTLLCRVCTAQGCQVRETEIQPVGSEAGLYTLGGSIAFLTIQGAIFSPSTVTLRPLDCVYPAEEKLICMRVLYSLSSSHERRG